MTTQIDVVDISDNTNDTTIENPVEKVKQEEVKQEEIKPTAKTKPRAKATTVKEEVKEEVT